MGMVAAQNCRSRERCSRHNVHPAALHVIELACLSVLCNHQLVSSASCSAPPLSSLLLRTAEVPDEYALTMSSMPEFLYLVTNVPEIISSERQLRGWEDGPCGACMGLTPAALHHLTGTVQPQSCLRPPPPPLLAMPHPPPLLPVNLIRATDLQTRLAVSRLHTIISLTWGLLGGEGAFVPLLAAYLFMCAGWGRKRGPGMRGRQQRRGCWWSVGCLQTGRFSLTPPSACSRPLPARLLRAVAIERFNLFALFLYVPRPAILAQAR